jgi:hypothetical protein
MATNATFFDFLVRGVGLDAKDKVNKKSGMLGVLLLLEV